MITALIFSITALACTVFVSNCASERILKIEGRLRKLEEKLNEK